MHFSRSFVASTLLGLAVATTHAGEEGAASQTVAASETLAAAASMTGAAVEATNGPAASGAPAPGGMVNTHVIQVGGPNGSLAFYPSNVIAEPGDLVQFQFMPKNHSVVQSTFDQPCVPIQDVMRNKTDAFFSGFMPNNRSAADTTNILTYTIRVMNKQPIWFYCSQGKHCQEGMVGAINAATSGNKTVEAFAGIAKVQTENISPGQQGGANPGGAEQSGAPAPTGTSGAGGEGGAGATGVAGQATASSNDDPAKQTANAAPGRLSDAAKQSFLGLGLGGLAAFMVL
ncbi:hypothetical protein K469DRAFT_725840 [Zopfia rhizophila CBS 207.26]|uniref:Cupredoxin n=1 Tax=Zopfia rhizophila CBS 207.26 TaxID=1314779 RepID=A0A6A6ET92_9PEZI|nr:hypothetical protein K469DRAFT_725840 [Zopfia rhizophila CBS 207.26]